MDKRILALLIAAMAGSAYAQSSTTNPPPAAGYLVNSGNAPVTNSANHCVHTSSWTTGLAAEPCDTLPRASLALPPVAAAAPAPEQPPEPIPNVIEKVSLNTDVLFRFNQADLLPGGEERLDQLAQKSQGANVERIVLAGFADRIGSEEHNQDLSERRAQAVADYLVAKGIDESHIQVEGRGEADPVTGDQCKNMGPEKAANKKLVACLQPDRRVEASLLGSREVAGGSPAATGA